MPIRWYGPADPTDPTYQHFARIVNLTVHAMTFAALNSGLWFFQLLRHPWPQLSLFSEIWLTGLLLHLAFVIVRRPRTNNSDNQP
ncbi:MAG: hypothetical protein AB8A40_05535 [Prochlorococcus sp.]|nr:hypothetical protein [Prochlorococcaceae cyanobacterium Fu_MAG_72]